ncbi:MAG: hypothetical protein DRJ52_09950, partial [Thermoprotei archaeon]
LLVKKENREWEEVTYVKNNYKRRRIHRFKRVRAEALRLEVLSTNGDRSARVYEIRVYNE